MKIDNDKEDLIQDFVSVITSFCARIYSQRISKTKTKKQKTNKGVRRWK